MNADSQSYKTIHVGLCEDGSVLQLTLDLPKGNVLTSEMMGEISDALRSHEDDPNLKMVLMASTGKNFSFGASVEEHLADQAPTMLSNFHGLTRQLVRYPVPIAAAVRGRCLGGAFEVVLSCHFVFATNNAIFSCPEIKLGVFPPVLAVLGSLRLGGGMAERLLLTGGELNANDALDIGFATAVFHNEDDLEEMVLQWYRENLSPLSAYAIRQGVTAIRDGSGMANAVGAPLDRAESLYLKRVVTSHDGNEGIEAFIARRKPAWKNA